MPFLNENEEMLRMMIAYFFGGNASKLLNSFCEYAKARDPSDDNDPHHWDVDLYLTGINIYSTNNGTNGIAYPGGMCKSNASCAIAEFGTTRLQSSNFTSSLIAAHEIGHVMSGVMGEQGQITWSKCSRDIAVKLWNAKECLRDHTINLKDAYDHSRYHDLPGRQWTAKAQCEIHFRDKNANVVSLLDICKTLQCETPHINKYYFTGPALEGTHCAHEKECRGGECVPVIKPPYIFKYCENNNWSEWKEGTRQSSCLKKSKGVRVRRRSCKHRSRRTANCEGPYSDVVLCDDYLLCTQERKSIDLFAAEICRRFSYHAIVIKLNLTFATEFFEPGRQAAYDVEKPWKACTIHCRIKNSPILYASHLETPYFVFDPYFPDGTWCHEKDG
nr:PREDICTED: A disintegrin and metalloproteinase with thrombospondin motifs 2-like [Linepithema humile]